MKVIRKISELKALVSTLKSSGKFVGFVPTMGALHEGHLSLIEKSKETCDVTVASIYVNPSQFNDSSDFELYPRTEDQDFEKLIGINCDVVFVPSVKEIESLPLPSKVDISLLENVMEGKERPGHFEGVIQVVYRLFLAVNPDFSFFGEKDFQQIMVVRKMVIDTGLKVKIIDCPIERASSGLALSSRNIRLSKKGIRKASSIYSILTNKELSSVSEKRKELVDQGFEVEYVEVHKMGDSSRLFAAVWLEGVRLIDNIALN